MKKSNKLTTLAVLLFVVFALCALMAFTANASCSESQWSAWSETQPQERPGLAIEAKSGNYKYQTRETTTSTNASLSDGWIQSGSSVSYGTWGSWSGWSTTAQSSSDTKNVETRTVYYYYHYCDGKGNFAPSTGYAYGKYGPHTLYSTKKLTVDRISPETGLSISDGEQKCEKSCGSYYYGGTKTQYRYQTRSKTMVYSYYRLSAAQLCSQSDITNGIEAVASEKCVPVATTVYRSRSTDHVLGAATIERMPTCSVPGIQVQICSVCGDRVETEIPTVAHNYSVEWIVDKAATCTTSGLKSHHCLTCGVKKDVTVIPATGHSFGEQWYTSKDPTCTMSGLRYQKCTICGTKGNEEYIPPVGHTYKKILSQASMVSEGKIIEQCATCGDIKSSQSIAKITTVKLNKVKYIYNGKTITPKVIVKDSEGKTLKKNVDYKVKYYENRSECGKHYVKVIFKGNYTGTKKLTYKVYLGKVTGLKQQDKPGINFQWDKVIGATSYEVQCYNKNTKSWDEYGTAKGTALGDSTIPKNTKKTFRVRAVAIQSGVIYNGAWSDPVVMKAKGK
ncbi:MAG: hypothetical protein IJL52_10335 [Clostridia bacterium]|nr:hypothetical protein [Clostridia bacterium]